MNSWIFQISLGLIVTLCIISSTTSSGPAKQASSRQKRKGPIYDSPKKRSIGENENVESEERRKDFATSGQMDNMPLMVLDINGFGPISFPIYSEKIVDLVKPHMNKSSFGMDDKLIYDESFRVSSELLADQFTVYNPEWVNYLKTVLLPKIGAELGFNSASTEAVLHKMLLYETGSFFSAHSDASKADGNFATLIIQLPSKFSGGQFKTSYNGLEKIFDYSTPSMIDGSKGNQFHGFYSAFYIEVEHEVKEISSGYRSCLVYNLIDATSSSSVSEKGKRLVADEQTGFAPHNGLHTIYT